MTNENVSRLYTGLQLLVLGALLWVAARQEEILQEVPVMEQTTTWVTSTGRTESFTSYRERDDSFHEFAQKHDAAVTALGGTR